MSYLDKLRALVATKASEVDAIISKASDGNRALLSEEHDQIKAIKTEIGELKASMEVERDAIQERAAAAEPAMAPVTPVGTVAAAPEVKMTGVQKMGLVAMAVTASSFTTRDGETQSVCKILSEAGFDSFSKSVATERTRKQEFLRTLNTTTGASGGFLTPDTMASDIVELLYPTTTFLQGKPRQVNMPNGTFRQPAGASGASAGYRLEGGEIATSDPTFREINMASKFLSGIVPMTRQMIDFTLPGAQQFIENDLRDVMSVAMDAGAYFGDGVGPSLLGIFNVVGISTFVASDGATLAKIDGDFSKLRLALLNDNIPNTGHWAYVMAPRTLEYLQNLRVGASDGVFAYPSLQGDNPKMGRIPVLDTTQVPINIGVGTDESSIGLVNFADVMLGMQGGVTMTTSSEATIKIGGAMVSAFQNDLVFLRALNAHDVAVRRVESIATLTEVKWGA